MNSFCTAVVIVVETSGDGIAVEAIRRYCDKAAARWMPHINLFFPFAGSDFLSSLSCKIQGALANFDPFELSFSEVSSFPQINGSTIHYTFSSKEKNTLRALKAAISSALPRDLITAEATFEPHFTLAQYPLPSDDRRNPYAKHNSAAALERAVQAGAPKFTRLVSEICIISRENRPNSTFSVVFRVPFRCPLSAHRQVQRVARGVPLSLDRAIAQAVIPTSQWMALQWVKRMRDHQPRKLPNTITALTNVLQTFCRVKVRLNVSYVVAQLESAKVISSSPFRKVERPPTPKLRGRTVRTPARGQGKGKLKITFQDGYKFNRAALEGVKTCPIPEPTLAPNTWNNDLIMSRVISWLKRCSPTMATSFEHVKFINQIEQICTVTIVVPCQLLMDGLVKDRVIQVSRGGLVIFV